MNALWYLALVGLRAGQLSVAAEACARAGEGAQPPVAGETSSRRRRTSFRSALIAARRGRAGSAHARSRRRAAGWRSCTGRCSPGSSPRPGWWSSGAATPAAAGGAVHGGRADRRRGRVRGAGDVLVARRQCRSAARARTHRRGRGGPRWVGGRRAQARPRLGARGGDACRGLVAAARGDVDEALSLLADAVEPTRRSAIPSGGRGRCLLSAPPAARASRSAPPARRSRRRSPASRTSERRAGRRRPRPSWDGSVAARRRRA